jgi:phosphoribosylpyrophosphate synthetase
MPSWGEVVGDDLRAYLKHICETIAGESEENAPVIAKTALEEVSGQLVQVATDVECSRYLESLVSHAAFENVVNLFKLLVQTNALVAVSTKCVHLVIPSFITSSQPYCHSEPLSA